LNPTIARAVRWIVTATIVVFLVIFARTIDWGAAWASIRGASLPLVLAATIANFVSIGIKGTRWWLFLKPAGAPSLGLATRATLAGTGLNNVLVANGGDAARVVFVTRATGLPSSRVLATLALERMFDLVGFVILLVYGIVAFELPASLERWAIPSYLALAAVIAFLVWFVHTSRHVTSWEVAEDRAAAHGWFGRAKAYLEGFALSTRSLATGPRFAGALTISMIAWALQAVTFEVAASAAHVDVSPAASLAALLSTNLGLLVRATPGNVGFFQFVYALTVGAFGVTRSDAIVVSLLIQTIQIVPLTLVGVGMAPEFIFGHSASKRAAESLTHESEPAMIGGLAKEGDELPAVPRET
jgi:uncharacterized protein (TIRG00374 family)